MTNRFYVYASGEGQQLERYYGTLAAAQKAFRAFCERGGARTGYIADGEEQRNGGMTRTGRVVVPFEGGAS